MQEECINGNKAENVSHVQKTKAISNTPDREGRAENIIVEKIYGRTQLDISGFHYIMLHFLDPTLISLTQE